MLLSDTAAQEQLSIKLGCTPEGKTVISHRYMAYPLSVSPVFRLEENEASGFAKRVYLYRMNTSPGLLANDALKVSLQLEPGSQLYLADQAATKVHKNARARVNYQIEIGDRATLEFFPEPLILFADSDLKQQTSITLHPTAALSLGEIILPGRLAHGELYQFYQYFSRLQVSSPEGNMWFAESMKLLGKENRFVQASLFASGPVLGSLVLILPEAIATPQALTTLSAEIDALTNPPALMLASSVLPARRGLFIRAMAQTTRDMQTCFKAAVNCVRKLRGEALLPYSLSR